MITEPQCDRLRFELFSGVAVTDENAIEVLSSQIVDEVAQSSQEIVNPVLRVHRPDIEKNRSTHAHQRRIQPDQPHSCQVGAIAHDKYLVRINSVTLDVDGPIALIRHDGDICELEGQLLKELKTPRYEAVSSIPIAREVELRG